MKHLGEEPHEPSTCHEGGAPHVGPCIDPRAAEWMHLVVVGPPPLVRAVLLYLETTHGFAEIDYCHLERPDFATADYGPVAPLTTSQYPHHDCF